MKPPSLAKGALAGIATTMPMTAAMELGRRSGLLRRPPPEQITDRLFAAARATKATRQQRRCVAALAHLATGATLGAIFAALQRPKRLRHRILFGATYGLGIYTLNYAGLAPTLRLMPPPSQDRPGRQLTTGLAHVVYGATLGCLLRPGPSPTVASVISNAGK
jgi:hypothetical protein